MQTLAGRHNGCDQEHPCTSRTMRVNGLQLTAQQQQTSRQTPAEVTQTTEIEEESVGLINSEQLSPDHLPTLTSFLRETGQSHATTTEFPGQLTVSSQPFNQFMSVCTNTPSSIHSSTAATESAARTDEKEEDSLLRASFNVNSRPSSCIY